MPAEKTATLHLALGTTEPIGPSAEWFVIVLVLVLMSLPFPVPRLAFSHARETVIDGWMSSEGRNAAVRALWLLPNLLKALVIMAAGVAFGPLWLPALLLFLPLAGPYYAVFPDHHLHDWDLGSEKKRAAVMKWRAAYRRLTLFERIARARKLRDRRRAAKEAGYEPRVRRHQPPEPQPPA